MREAVKAKKARSGAAGLRALPEDVHYSLAAKWDNKFLAEYLCAGHRSFKHAKVIGATDDGARLGNPAEETVTFAFWSPQPNEAMVGVPQATPLVFTAISR